MDWKDFSGANYPPMRNDLLNFLGQYYNAGEFGVVFEMKGFPEHLVKIVNLDLEDDENLINQSQALFINDVYNVGNNGSLPNINYFLEFELTELIMNHIQHIILLSDAPRALQVLEMEDGDTMAVWIMEKLANIGKDEDLTDLENATLVGKAAAAIFEDYGYAVEDLQEDNFGQTNNDKFVILDPQIIENPPNELYLMNNNQLVEWFVKNKVWVGRMKPNP